MKWSDHAAAGSVWTLQELTIVGRHPWYALPQHSITGIALQYTGYQHELDDLARARGVVPRMRPPTNADYFWRTYGVDERPKMCEPHKDSGTYRGLIVGVTANSIIQEIASKHRIAHNAHDLDRSPVRGERVVVHYSNGRGAVKDSPLREFAGKSRGLVR